MKYHLIIRHLLSLVWIKRGLLFFLTWFSIHTLIITYDGLVDDVYSNADTAVVLGNKVNEDGSLSHRLKARLDKCISLHSTTPFEKIVVSGGLGIEGHWEGTKMADYLISNGISSQTIIIDNKGNNTQLTAENFKAMNLHYSGVVVVSQFYHISRTKLAFKTSNITPVYGASPHYYEWKDFYSTFREFFGFYAYLFYTMRLA